MKHIAQKIIDKFKNDAVIMKFVTDEALKKVSDEMNAKGLSTTPKGVELLIQSKRNANIKSRVDSYINAGIAGCIIAGIKRS